MNILAGRFPTSVEIGGREYALNTDYRIGLKCILAWEDQELTAREKTLVMLRLLYKEIPPDTQKACELAVYFLNCGEEKEGKPVLLPGGSTALRRMRSTFTPPSGRRMGLTLKR